MISLGIESSYYSEDEEVREEIKENKNLKKELEELFNFFEGGRNEQISF